MRVPLLPALLILVIGILVDCNIYRSLRHARANRILCLIYAIVAAVLTVGLGIVILSPKKAVTETELAVVMWTLFTYLSFYVPKYIFVIVNLIRQLLSWIFKRPLRGITIGAGAVCIALFIALWWGALFTRTSVDVRRVDVPVANLPHSFEGYKIVQISDIHTGTFFGNPEFLEKVVRTVNGLDPDVILFTGDIVNRHSAELIPFTDVLACLHAPDGVWSVMGNHDYGEYYRWPAEQDRLDDVNRLKAMQGAMGWHMLNNASDFLRRGNDSIVLIGVENIGDPPFTTYGDLSRSYPDLSDNNVKILMTHNPSHWVDSIADKPDVNIALTLSGHTHGMQVKILGWSPASFRYPTWGGLYTDSLGRELYVNIGLGEVGFPSRIGATPEITLITLKAQDKSPKE